MVTNILMLIALVAAIYLLLGGTQRNVMNPSQGIFKLAQWVIDQPGQESAQAFCNFALALTAPMRIEDVNGKKVRQRVAQAWNLIEANEWVDAQQQEKVAEILRQKGVLAQQRPTESTQG